MTKPDIVRDAMYLARLATMVEMFLNYEIPKEDFDKDYRDFLKYYNEGIHPYERSLTSIITTQKE